MGYRRPSLEMGCRCERYGEEGREGPSEEGQGPSSSCCHAGRVLGALAVCGEMGGPSLCWSVRL